MKKELARAVPFDESGFLTDERPCILFVAMYAPTGTNGSIFNSDFMVDGFNKAGYRVEVMDWQKIRFNEGIEGLHQRILYKAMAEKPELIFLHIQTVGILSKEFLDELNKVSFTVSYNFDCRTFKDTEWQYELAPHLGYSFVSNKEDVLRCNAFGIFNVGVLHSSADFNHYKRIKVEITEDDPEIVFIGNNFETSNLDFQKKKERVELVKFMQENFGNRFKAYGRGWDNSGIVNQQEEVVIYNKAKIAITHNNFYRTAYQSDRAYRAMGSGCLTIMQYYPEINKDFTPQVASTWLNFDMLKTECERYLENEEERIKKANAGYDWVRHQHSWHNRAMQMTEILNQYKVEGDR